jgi:hypothetical protein
LGGDHRHIGTGRKRESVGGAGGFVDLEAGPAESPLQPVRTRRGIPEEQNMGTDGGIRHEIAHARKETRCVTR